MDKLTRKEIEHHNDYNYHCDTFTWGWIDDIFREVMGGTEVEEGIKSQLIAESMGLTEDDG